MSSGKYKNIYVIVFIFILSKFFISREIGEVNSIWVFIENIGFALLIVSNYRALSRFKINNIIIFFILYYCISVFWIINIDSFVTLFHHFLRGIMFILIGYLIFTGFNNPFNREGVFVSELLFYSLSVAIFLEVLQFTSYENLIANGAGGSFVALIGLITTLQIFYIETSSKKQKIIKFARMVLIFFIVFKLNSLSSMVFFLISVLMAMLFFKKYKFIFLTLLVFVPTGSFVYDSLVDGDIRIARKDLSTIQEGTGRFETWKACSSMIVSGEVPVLGAGLMNEKDLLKNKNLNVSHTCHNSILSNIFSFGIIGALLYLLFLVICLYELIFCINNKSNSLFIYFVFIFSMVLFGQSSGFVPGMPSILISYFVWFSLWRKTLYEEKNINYRI